MSEQIDVVASPWEQLGMGFTKQQGPDGRWYVSLHIGSPAMSCAILLPPEQADQYFDSMREEVKKVSRECRLSNGGILRA